MVKFGLIITLFLSISVHAKTIWYDIDYTKSSITFLAKSRLVNASGIFHKWSFKGKIGQNFKSVGDLVIDTTSIDTDNERRDKHLKNEDFFHTENYPHATLRIKAIDAIANSNLLKLSADLTIRGITKPIQIEFKKDGDEKSPIFSSSYVLNREDFGMTYNNAMNPIDKLIHLQIKLQLIRREK